MATVFVEIKMLKDSPAIVGTDAGVYGPFVKDRVYAVPKDNARQFLKHGLAVATRQEAEKPTLKELFKGEVLDGYVEAALVKPLIEVITMDERRKALLERSQKLVEEIQEERSHS